MQKDKKALLSFVQMPDHFDHSVVLNQLRYSGMLETVRIRRAGFPVRRTFQDFCTRWVPCSVTISVSYQLCLSSAFCTCTVRCVFGLGFCCCTRKAAIWRWGFCLIGAAVVSWFKLINGVWFDIKACLRSLDFCLPTNKSNYHYSFVINQ